MLRRRLKENLMSRRTLIPASCYEPQSRLPNGMHCRGKPCEIPAVRNWCRTRRAEPATESFDGSTARRGIVKRFTRKVILRVITEGQGKKCNRARTQDSFQNWIVMGRALGWTFAVTKASYGNIRDVVERCGISVMTVSIVQNDEPPARLWRACD